MAAAVSLDLRSRIPPAVEVKNVRRLLQIEAEAAGLPEQREQRRAQMKIV